VGFWNEVNIIGSVPFHGITSIVTARQIWPKLDWRVVRMNQGQKPLLEAFLVIQMIHWR